MEEAAAELSELAAADSEQKRSPNIADRPSYKRWQLSSKNIADSDSPS